MPDAVVLDHVSKSFGPQNAVDDVSLRVPEQTVYGFIGPNGSGKTTTLRMISHILHPDAGSITVFGSRALAAANDQISYLPEERGLYKQMKVRDILTFCAQLKNHKTNAAEIDAWLERLELPGVASKRVEQLSKGMSQKVQLIAALISKPKLVLLDEPFSGLDPVNAKVLVRTVLELKQSGTTVLFSTHDMAVAEKMCDAICMIYNGRKVLDGTMDQIQQTYGTDTIHVRMESAAEEAHLANIPGVASVVDFNKLKELRIAPGTDPQTVLAELVRRGRVNHFEVARPSLQEIFVRIASPANDSHPPFDPV